MNGAGPNPDFLLGGRTSAFAKCRHWSGRAVRWSSCAILLRPSFYGGHPGAGKHSRAGAVLRWLPGPAD